MNSTTELNDGPDEQGEGTMGPYSYSIGVSFGILVLVIVVTYSYYVYNRIKAHPNPNRSSHSGGSYIDSPNTTRSGSSDYDESHCSQGLDEATLLKYPKLLYSEVLKPHERDCTASGCSICLQDYKDIDQLRLLPQCGHFFHIKCVDPWLRLHPTCPVCRTTPISTPLDTPVVCQTSG